jgi:hypothetical protein
VGFGSLGRGGASDQDSFLSPDCPREMRLGMQGVMAAVQQERIEWGSSTCPL